MEVSTSTNDHCISSETGFISQVADTGGREYREIDNENSGAVLPETVPKGDKEFRRLIIELSNKILPHEFDKAKFLLGGEIKKRKMEKIKTLMDLCVVLKERCFLNENNLDCLLELFHILERDDLVQLVTRYFMNCEVNSRQHPYATGDEMQAGTKSLCTVSAGSNKNVSETQSNDVKRSGITRKRNQQTQTDGKTLDTETEGLLKELKYLSYKFDTEKRLRSDMQELLFSRCELNDYGIEISKLYMHHNEKTTRFLHSKLLRIYPQCLYGDIYS